MNALLLTLFVSALLVALWIGLFVASVRRHEHQHGVRLALLPLEDDAVVAPPLTPSPSSTRTDGRSMTHTEPET